MLLKKDINDVLCEYFCYNLKNKVLKYLCQTAINLLAIMSLECDPRDLFKELKIHNSLHHYIRHLNGTKIRIRYSFEMKPYSPFGYTQPKKADLEYHFNATVSAVKFDLPKIFKKEYGKYYRVTCTYEKFVEAFMFLHGMGYQWTIPTEKKHPTRKGDLGKEYFNLDGVEITKNNLLVDQEEKKRLIDAKNLATRIQVNDGYYQLAQDILTTSTDKVRIFGGFARDSLAAYFNMLQAVRALLMIHNRRGTPFDVLPRDVVRYLCKYIIDWRDPAWCFSEVNDIDSPDDFMRDVKVKCIALSNKYKIISKKQGEIYRGKKRHGGYLHCTVTVASRKDVPTNTMRIDMVSVFEDMILDIDVNSLVLQHDWTWTKPRNCPIPMNVIQNHVENHEFVTLNEPKDMYYRIQSMKDRSWIYLNKPAKQHHAQKL
jgi:hypothetical protein